MMNDAYLNIYTTHSEFGDVQAASTAKLWKNIHEIYAVAKMKEIFNETWNFLTVQTVK